MHQSTSKSIQPQRAPVLFIVFNRPDTVRQVFEAIRTAKPPRLYIGVDGPRKDRPGEAEHVAEVLQIVSQVDWPCTVHTLVREENLGCKVALYEAITWFFEHEEQGIILEEDCLPNQSFFGYCEQLLEFYKTDSRIFMISGYNQQNTWYPEKWDYFFSNVGGIWGWASWRRAWKHYDPDKTAFNAFSEQQGFANLLGEKYGGIRAELLSIDSWDSAWAFTRHMQGALTCVPARSLMQYIGYGPDATHTKKAPKKQVIAHEIELPVRINPFFVPDRSYEALVLEQPPAYTVWIFKVKQYVRALFRSTTVK